MAEHPAETMRRAAMLLRSEPGTVSPPGLADALELLLEHEADRCDRRVSLALAGWWCHECGDYITGRCGCWGGALATARAILGEAP